MYKNTSKCIYILTIFMLQGLLDDELLQLFLTDGVGINNVHPNPASNWLSEKSWAEIVRASKLPR